MDILARSGAVPVYNPCSNLKLVSGEIFPYSGLKKRGVNICLGTDSAASNNSLDMLNEVKFASLLQKHREKDPTVLPASESLSLLGKNGAKALRMDSGEIKENKLADFVLIDLNKISFAPRLNLVSDLVYSATGDCVSDVVCNGKVIMRDYKVEGESEITRKASFIARNLVKG